MGLRDKAIKALSEFMEIEFVRLQEDDRISGFVVSPQFQGLRSLDRQELIDKALLNSSNPLTSEEYRHILMIAALTPEEYEAVGSRIRVHKVKELGDGRLEILLHGAASDAEYVRGTLKNEKGVETTEPEQVPGAIGALMSFQAKGTGAARLSKAKAVRILKKDQYIEVTPNA